MSSVLVIGEALVDVVHSADGSAREYPGGSPLNVAIGLSRLGRATQLLAHLGDDERGAAVLAHLRASGVEIVDGTVRPGATSTAQATLAADGSASYVFDLTWELPEGSALDAALPEAPLAVHTGSIGSWFEPGAGAVSQLVQRYRATATTSFDPNVRPSLMGDPTLVRERIDALIDHCDVVKLSDEDADWLQPGGDHEALLASWVDRGVSLAVMTRGAQGLVARARSGRAEVRAQKVTVADTVGAGDSVMAALIDGLAEHDLLGAARREALRDIHNDDVQTLLAHAARVGAITVSRPGADPPWRRELLGV
ncbi:fructokinase [Quadrisphaera granulorum]|uniref:Fructokinase n=1 Tax=Quadrisphaera granulorum TaxID=317664 RepID=A0A316B0W9_9ACTN|nr:carbohydrate kinase [Quadrisphaera granulorum]PWJ56137.1 fructokinase [Quadrisphaera granulorum]SZE94771.1 fructokinase [Quadrisphaera granulorum]